MSAKVIIGIVLVVFIIAGLIVLRLNNRKKKRRGAVSVKGCRPICRRRRYGRDKKNRRLLRKVFHVYRTQGYCAG